MKLLLLLVLTLSMTTLLCKDFIPQKYEVQEQILSIGIDTTLSAEGKKFGQIKQNMFSIGHNFELMDNSKKKLAEAEQRVITIGTDYLINDNEGYLIGSIISPIAKNWIPFVNYYDVYDENQKLISTVKFYKLFAINVEVFDPKGKKIMEMTRKFHLIQSKWTIKYQASKNMDQKFKIIHSFLPSIISAFYDDQHAHDHNDVEN